MKTFVVTILIIVLLLAVGGFAFAKYRGACGGPDGRMGWMMERISKRLELDGQQQAQLAHLRDTFFGLRQDLRTARSEGREDISRLIAAPTLDRDEALSMLQVRQETVSRKGQEIIDAVADFTDSLDPTQRERLIEWMNSRRHGRFGHY